MKAPCKVPAVDFNDLSVAFSVLDDALIDMWLRASFNYEARAGLPAVLKVVAACLERSRERIRSKSNAIICRKRITVSSALEFTVPKT